MRGPPTYGEPIAIGRGATGPRWYRWLTDLWRSILSLESSVATLLAEPEAEEETIDADVEATLVLLAWALRRIDMLEKLHCVEYKGNCDTTPKEVDLLSEYEITVR